VTEKTPAGKMRLKPGMAAALLHVPAELRGRLADGVTVVDDLAKAGPADAGFLLDFATTQAEAEERLVALAPFVGEKTVVWIAYPKGAKAAGRDVSRDTIWRFAQTIGLTLVANVAIDGTWSALRVKRASAG